MAKSIRVFQDKMKRHNLFDGDSYYSIFARLTYKRIISYMWFSYADIMADSLMLESPQELPCNLSKCDHYVDLKKAFRDVFHIIKQRAKESCFEEKGNNRNKSFRYIGLDKDPLADIKNAKVITNLRKYWKFCQDSSGFFPTAWLEYFFKDCQDLLDIKAKKHKGEQVLSSSLDIILTNIELLPMFYEAIIDHSVLSVEYKPYEEEVQRLVYHPHYIKEFNGRWHILGHADGMTPEFGYNLAIDRIIGKPEILKNTTYKQAPDDFYDHYFKDIIGVSHLPGYDVEEIHIRANSLYIYKLTETKPIHPSQKTIVPYETHQDGSYGEFTIKCEVNNEFIGRILQMGAGLEIVSPESVREVFKQRVADLAKLYE